MNGGSFALRVRCIFLYFILYMRWVKASVIPQDTTTSVILLTINGTRLGDEKGHQRCREVLALQFWYL